MVTGTFAKRESFSHMPPTSGDGTLRFLAAQAQNSGVILSPLPCRLLSTNPVSQFHLQNIPKTNLSSHPLPSLAWMLQQLPHCFRSSPLPSVWPHSYILSLFPPTKRLGTPQSSVLRLPFPIMTPFFLGEHTQ